MSDSLRFTAVQDAIAALAVPGIVRIYTSRNVPEELWSRLCPCVIPDPDSPIIESNSQRLTVGTLSGGSGWMRPRTLAYVCLTAEVGELRGAYINGERTALVWDALENALCDFRMDGQHQTGPVVLAGAFPVNDHSGKLFFGFKVRYTYLTSY